VPITLKVGAEPDNRSFKQAADQAVQTFTAAGKEASGGFSKSLAAGSKDIQKATSTWARAYDSLADATGRVNVAERQRQQSLEKSDDLAKKAAEAEKRLQAARDTWDTKALTAAEKDLDRIRDQQSRTTTAIIRSAESANRARRQEQQGIREAIAAYRDLEAAKRGSNTGGGFGRSLNGAFAGMASQSSGLVGQFSALGGSSGKAFVGGAVASILAGGFVAAGVKAAGMVVDGFKSVMDTGIDFQKTVNNFQGVTQATATQTAQMAAAARALGADTSLAGVSSTDAALAMTELAKAGFSVDDAMNAARGTMELATAAQIDSASAAEIQANAINAFGLSAKDAPHVADVLANAAVGSSADITDLGQALQQVGGVARGFGIDVEDTVAAIGMLANVGVKGTDAGTSLKTMLLSLRDPSNTAQEAITGLGLSLDDANGQFVGFGEFFRQLDEAKARMAPNQFQTLAAQLFGTDAIRAPMLGTMQDFQKLEAVINRFGTANNMAKAQMQGWPGVVEGVSNSMEALKLSFFDIFNSPSGQQFGQTIIDGAQGLVEWVNAHKPEIIGFVAAFGSAMATATDVSLLFFESNVRAVALWQDALSYSIGIVIGAIGNMASAYGGFLKYIPGMKSVGESIEQVGNSIEGAMSNWRQAGPTLRTLAQGVEVVRDGVRGYRDEFTSAMRLTQAAEEQTRRYEASFKDLSKAVSLVPGTKQIIVNDNSDQVINQLKSLGFIVQNLPNGTITVGIEYRDPSGKIVDPNQLGVSQRQLDDANSRQHSWFKTPDGQPQVGAPNGWTPGASGGSKSLPAAPAVPYAALPGLMPGVQMTPEIYSAQTRVADAQTTLAEKQARLNQLLKSNVATEDDIQNARNDVVKAGYDVNEAQMRFIDAQQKTTNKQTKSLKDMTSTMGEIGAQLDSDFGISKGLAGIADNIVRFVATLAAAPLLGALSAVEKANPNEGSGLVGILAANGAFGDKYTPGAIAASNATASTSSSSNSGVPSTGNANVDAMFALAQSASGKTAYAPASDLINGLADCSGSISDLYEVLTTGQSSPARMFTTTNFASDADAAKLGFLPGYQPGAFNIGVNPYPGQSGHMAATLPNGVNFEGGGGTGGGAQYGGSAAGALSPQFEKHYYLPLGGATGAGPAPVGGSTSTSAPALPSTGGTVPVFVVNMPGGGGLVNLPAGPTTVGPDAAVPAVPSVPSVPGAPGVPGLFSPENTNPGLNNPALPGGGGGAPPGLPGMGMPRGLPMGGPPISFLGGQPYPSAGGGGGGGIGLGGMAMDGLMASTGALDMMAPGAGAAAKIGIQVINRTIKYGSQVAGIGMSGLLDTITPSGDKPMASIGNSWPGKLLGGIASAAPALPNMAGGKTPGPIGGGGKGDGQGQNGNTINNTVNQTNHYPTSDIAANSAVREMGHMYDGPGK